MSWYSTRGFSPARPAIRTRSVCARRRTQDIQQLDVEHQRRAAGDFVIAAIAVGEVGGTHQPRLPAYLHALHALGPAANDVTQRKFRRLVARVGAVELLPV